MALIAKLTPLTLGLTTVLLLSGCDKQTSDAPTHDDNPQTIEMSSEESSDRVSTTEATNEANNKDSRQIENALKNGTSKNETVDENDPTATPMKDHKNKPSLVTNPVTPNSPEATVKQAFDTLYYGDAKKAATYYQVDMKNFDDELAKTQHVFQQTVDTITFTSTKYNKDKTEATIEGELRLKGQEKPTPSTYHLKKIDGQWKILG